MGIIGNTYLTNNYVFFKEGDLKQAELKNKISSLAKNIFSYIHRNRYALSVAIWTSLFIQVGVNASSISLPELVDDLENCTDTFCFYFNKIDTYSHPFCFSPCCNRQSGMEVFPSLEKCQNSLAALYSYYKHTYWNTVCPSVDLEDLGKNLTEYMNECFHKLCLEDDFINFMGEDVFNWCSLQEITNSQSLIRNLSQEVIPIDSSEWTKEDILDMMLSFFINVTENTESVLASIISSEKLLTPAFYSEQSFDFIKKGIKKLLSSSIHLIKEGLNTESNENYLKISEILNTTLKNLEKIFV